MVEPNDQQRAIIDQREGLHCVDAGAGTGKTFAITRRYTKLVEQAGVDPQDVLLVTFTNSGAREMRERVLARSSYGMRELRDAPIQTFHSHCHEILSEYGFDAPSLLGIDDVITDSTQTLDNELIEREYFVEFVEGFSEDHPEYADVLRAVSDPMELLGLIKRLVAKGVFPTADGWYRHGEAHLDGDREAFREAFEAANEARNDGRRQSRLRSKLGRYGRDRCYLPDAPTKDEIRGEGKIAPSELVDRVFEADRVELKAFVHDLYFGYLAFALRRNYLTFGFRQLFAFVLLCENHRLREEHAFEYVLVDEFQDTSEIQFKLALLLCGTGNLCVVGDWKQSIFSFQYAAIENLTDFGDRLARFAAELNDDHERVRFDVDSINEIELTENYRSTQSLLDFAEHGLLVPASNTDPIDRETVRDRLVSLTADRSHDHTRTEAIQHPAEAETVLTKIQQMVGDDAYGVAGQDGELRPPTFGDIAVLTRTRDFGRELLHAAETFDLPMAYEGGIELFRTDQAKLVLAWLRILEGDDRGWATVLERAGYTLEEISHVLDRETYPLELVTFRAELARLESIGGLVQRVLSRYGYDGTYGDVLLATIKDVLDATTMTRGDLVRFIQRSIAAGSTQEVQASAGADSVTVQTIHAAKGLEHPIVILANMNRYKFPSRGGSGGTITFNEPIGLRQRRVYAEAHGHPHLYDDWRWDVLRPCLPGGHDEERRLLYVAMTRAENHLVFAAGEEPSRFLEELPVSIEELEPDVTPVGPEETVQSALGLRVPLPEGPRGTTPHDLMREDVFVETPEGKGTAFGARVHAFAEAYARGDEVDLPAGDEPDWEHVTAFIDSLEGELSIEQDAMLPLRIDGDDVTIKGVVDLVHVHADGVDIVDYKTDRTRRAAAEYRKQLSVYYQVLRDVYPDRRLTASLFYTADGERVAIDPFTCAEITDIVRDALESPS